MASAKPKESVQARQMAARALQFFRTYAENDNAAVKRSLGCIVGGASQRLS